MSDDLPADAAALLAGFVPGSRVAGYLLIDQIGAGGMAVVFRARDERLDRVVALKVLAPALTADHHFRRRFMRESRAAAAVDDPHIVPVHEAGEAGGVLFIAMRYVPGGSVADLLHDSGPLTAGRAAAIISPIASALDTAHAAGLVHRDVKPANILVDVRPDRPDHVYLSDFGLTKGSATSTGLTGSGQMLGTPGYMAPEQIDGSPVDGRADQYALACAAFELLTGEVPFRRDQGIAVLWAHLAQPPPKASSRRPDLGESVDRVFEKALSKAPADRYAKCREFADDLRHSLGLAPYHASSSHSSRARGGTGRGPLAGDTPAPAGTPEPAGATGRVSSAGDDHSHAIGPAVSASSWSQGPHKRTQAPHRDPSSSGETLPRVIFGDAGLSPRREPDLAAPDHQDQQRIVPRKHSPRSGQRRTGRLRTASIALGGALFLIAGVLVTGYLVVRSQYYVAATTDGKVAIFRGINDNVLGFKLNGVYQATNIPVSGIPATAVAELRRADTGSLAQARTFLGNITEQYNTCQSAQTALRTWIEDKPTKKVKQTILVQGHRRTVFRLPPYDKPKPKIPAFCPTQTSA